MEAGSGLFGAISESVKLIGNLNSLSVIQDDIISSTNDNNHIHGVAGEMGLIKVGGGAVSPMLPEASDLIYTDLSYNVTIKQEGEDGSGQIVPGGESSSVLSWGAGFGGGGALNDLVNGGNLNAGAFGGSMSAAVINDGFGIEDLDNVSCPTPNLSDNDNFSFLSDSEGGGEKFPVKIDDTENDYVRAWVSSEPPNPFPLPSLATMSVFEQVASGTISGGGAQLSVMNGGEGDSFSTINTEDLDDLLGPTAVSSGLKCADCRKTFDNPLTLQIHMRLHTGERPYKCKQCGEGFIHYTYLDYHMKNSHGKESPKSNSTTNQRRNSQVSSNSREGNGVSQPASGVGNSGIKTKKKKLKNGLVENKSSPVGVGGPFPCPYCHRGFRHSSWLIMHLRTHTGEKPFKCTHCDLAYTQRGNLMGHLKKIHNITNYEPIATTATTTTIKPEDPVLQSTPTSTNLTVRRKKKKKPAAPNSNYSKIGSDSQNGTSEVVNTNKGSRPVKCTICGEEFSHRQDLSAHMRVHGGASFSCSECGRMFRQSANLQKHRRDVHGSIDTPTQGRRQSTGSSKKKKPALPLPSEAAPYTEKFNIRQCAIELKRCDRRSLEEDEQSKGAASKKPFSSKKKIGGRMHGKIARRPMAFPPSGPGYKCKICSKVLLTTTNLTVHMRIHTGEKPYECSFCKKKFSVQSNLKAHERLHTGEKPHQCKICSTAFTTRGNFTAHLRSHGVNPYKCSLCTEQFTFSWKLKKHMLVAHNKKMKAEHKQIFN